MPSPSSPVRDKEARAITASINTSSRTKLAEAPMVPSISPSTSMATNLSVDHVPPSPAPCIADIHRPSKSSPRSAFAKGPSPACFGEVPIILGASPPAPASMAASQRPAVQRATRAMTSKMRSSISVRRSPS